MKPKKQLPHDMIVELISWIKTHASPAVLRQIEHFPLQHLLQTTFNWMKYDS